MRRLIILLFWVDEKNFLITDDFHPYSPEYHRIIRSGKIVSHKPYLDKELYTSHVNEHEDKEYTLPVVCAPYILKVIRQDDLKSFKKAIRAVPEDENAIIFIEDLFIGVYNFYASHQDIYDGENAFNRLFLFPFLKAVTRATSAELDTVKTDFCDGEVCLESMSTQLKIFEHDGR